MDKLGFPGGVNQLWVGDITYVPLQRGGVFCYLAALMDRCSRDIAGWELAETMTDGKLTLAALRMAIRRSGSRRPSWFITPIAAVNTLCSAPLSCAQVRCWVEPEMLLKA